MEKNVEVIISILEFDNNELGLMLEISKPRKLLEVGINRIHVLMRFKN
jgi:hypothetical protein